MLRAATRACGGRASRTIRHRAATASRLRTAATDPAVLRSESVVDFSNRAKRYLRAEQSRGEGPHYTSLLRKYNDNYETVR